jgi:hypothetical protein
MPTIRIHNATHINAEGNHTRGNAKAVFCITTGDIYASVTDAAESLGCTPSSVSWAITNRMKTCKGLRFCPVSKITEYLEEIAEYARARQTKVTAYDAIIAEQNARANAQANLEKAMARRTKLLAEIAKNDAMIAEAQRYLNN